MKNVLLGSLIVLLVMPAFAAASHNSGGIDRDDLDDDVEEDIYMPILFYDLDDLTPNFGAPRDGGTRTHEGQDILAPQGTPIVSPTEAIVISTGVWSGSGNFVTTANPGGETFRYMHLDEFADIKRGDELDAGDFIGTVGDTGNAPDGVYHLHFEILDEDNDPVDPFDRITKEFSLKNQVSYVRDVFRDIRDDEEYAEFLVETYPTVFQTAYEEDWTLHRDVKDILEDSGIDDEIEAREGLGEVLEIIPQVVQSGLKKGDDSVLVALMQLYLIYTTDGPERDRLADAGPTGYYGAITAEAFEAFQDDENIAETGEYDSKTRSEMLKREVKLNLDS